MRLVVIAAAAAGFDVRMCNIDDRAKHVVAAIQKLVGRASALEFDITWIAPLSCEVPCFWTRTLSIDPGYPLEVLVLRSAGRSRC